jgi:pimeloyl-ACP methyl ester carboxylesterase
MYQAPRALQLAIIATLFLVASPERLPAQEFPGAPRPEQLNVEPLNFNVEFPTWGGKQLWTDVLHFHEWRIQRNVFTAHYRLLDGEDKRHAWGTYQQCRVRLEQITAEKNLPPMQGKAVLLLHGLFRTRESMAGMAEYLEREGGYQVFRVSYASTRGNMDAHAVGLAKVIENLHGVDEINFVAHSLGNLVIRRYLAIHTDPLTGELPDPRIRRMVMLAPPNNGAELARIASRTGLFNVTAGASGTQLVDGWEDLRQGLATPGFEFGIIAGGAGKANGRNPLLTGDDDLVVTVEETKLPGAHDFLVLPPNHTWLMDDPQVRQSTLRFLQQGWFVSEAERKPLEP